MVGLQRGRAVNVRRHARRSTSQTMLPLMLLLPLNRPGLVAGVSRGGVRGAVTEPLGPGRIVFLNENGRKSHSRVAALSLTDQLSIVNN